MKRLFALLMALMAQGAVIQPADKSSYHPIASPLPPTDCKGFYATAVPWQKRLDFYKNFTVVEFGSFEDIADADTQGFDKIVAYEWMAGFYRFERNVFTRYALAHPKKLLNREPISKEDYFYDMCDAELVDKRVEYLVSEVKRLHIAGLFFDWANDLFLDEEEYRPLAETLKKRHPHTDYAACLKHFLARLKTHHILIITNQAYRNPELLQYVDYDMCESYMSAVEESDTIAPIGNVITNIPYTLYQPLEEVFAYFDHFHKLQKRYGFKNMIYMNYLAPKFVTTSKGLEAQKPIEGIYYNYVLAKLGGFAQFSEVPFDHTLEIDPIYFYDLGTPLNGMRKEGDIYFRFFSKGFVLLAPTLHQERYIAIDMPKSLYDLKEGCKLLSIKGKVTIRLAPVYDEIVERYEPIAKVFLYED